jgi:dihydrofolate reductase
VSRPVCAVFIATSVDGYIAREDGGIDWLARVEVAGEDYGYGAFLESVDALVIGRATYEVAAGFEPWPYAGKRCVVMSHRPIEDRHGEEAAAGDVAAVVARLGAQGVRRIYVDGGKVIQQFLAAGLIDELTISVIPVVLGAGVRLFAAGVGEHVLVVLGTRGWASGLVQTRWRVAR